MAMSKRMHTTGHISQTEMAMAQGKAAFFSLSVPLSPPLSFPFGPSPPRQISHFSSPSSHIPSFPAFSRPIKEKKYPKFWD
jgi:hypothetical protein